MITARGFKKSSFTPWRAIATKGRCISNIITWKVLSYRKIILSFLSFHLNLFLLISGEESIVNSFLFTLRTIIDLFLLWYSGELSSFEDKDGKTYSPIEIFLFFFTLRIDSFSYFIEEFLFILVDWRDSSASV